MVLNFERVSVGTESMIIGGGVEDWDERDDVRIVNCNELVGFLFLSQVLEFVHYDVHGATSWFFIQLLMKACR